MKGVPQPAERVELTKAPDVVAGRPYTVAYDVTSPTMTVFPPRGRNTGASMVVFPGGGFKLLAMDLEGTEICDWITAKGITCVLLKYRVPKSNHYWDKDCHCHITPKIPRALQDAQRTIRLVRARAKELNLDPNITASAQSPGGVTKMNPKKSKTTPAPTGTTQPARPRPGTPAPATAKGNAPVFKEVSKEKFKELYFRLGGGKSGWTAEYWQEFFENKAKPGWKFMVEEPRSAKHIRMFIVSDAKAKEYRMFFMTEEEEDSTDWPGDE
jgi:hypothetical protein